MLAQAAFYYFMNNEDPHQILSWLNQALALGDERWVHYQKVAVLERMKNYPKAREAANAAIAYLTKTKPAEWNDSVREYQARIKSWPLK